MAEKIKSKFTGVYSTNLKNGDKCFFFNYKDINDNNKLKWVKVGRKSENYNLEIANRQRIEQLSKMRHGEDITAVSQKKQKELLTFQDLADRYFIDKNINKYRQNRYNNHIKNTFAKLNVEYITKIDIQRFLNELSQNNAPGTVNGIREIITAMFNHSIKEYELKIVNPCVGIKRLKEDNERERYLTTSEIKSLFKKIESNKPIWLFTKIALSTGARVMSIADIQKKDLNLNTATVTIKNHKTNNTYKGFLQSDLVEFLKDYTKDMKMNDYICCVYGKGTKPTQKNIQWRLKPIMDELFNKELDLDDRKNRVVIHSLRHTFASHLAINGTPIFTIQKLMDHAKIEQTLRYAKLAPDSGKQNVERLYQ